MEINSEQQPDKSSTLGLLMFSGIGIFALIGYSLYLGITKIPSLEAPANTGSTVLEIVAWMTVALLLLPMFYVNWRLARGKSDVLWTIPPVYIWQLLIIGALWAFILLIGSIFGVFPSYGWIGLIPLVPLGVLLPVFALLWISMGGLVTTSRRRLWSVLGFGMAGGTSLAMAGEYVVVLLGRWLGEVFWGARPEWRFLVDELGDQLAKIEDPQRILEILSPYLSSPWVLGIALGLAAVIVPMIEEAFKPAVLFFIGKRFQSVAEGFALGALCGGGFALVEGMLALGAFSPLWGAGVMGRLAASVMHITLSALMGGAIASVFLHKNYRRLLGTYFLSVGLHGLWNGMAVLAFYGAARLMVTGIYSAEDLPIGQIALFSFLILLAVAALFVLFVAGLVALSWLNFCLRKGLLRTGGVYRR